LGGGNQFLVLPKSLRYIRAVSVTQVLYDPGSVATSTIQLYQLGGTIEGHPIVVEGDPPFQVGDRVILFLRPGSPGLYRVQGGPTGRFVLSSDGTVRPIAANGISLQAGTTLSQFETMVQNA
jgi:hypothetical protein